MLIYYQKCCIIGLLIGLIIGSMILQFDGNKYNYFLALGVIALIGAIIGFILGWIGNRFL